MKYQVLFLLCIAINNLGLATQESLSQNQPLAHRSTLSVQRPMQQQPSLRQDCKDMYDCCCCLCKGMVVPCCQSTCRKCVVPCVQSTGRFCCEHKKPIGAYLVACGAFVALCSVVPTQPNAMF